MADDAAAAEIEQVRRAAGALIVSGAWPPHWPEPITGSANRTMIEQRRADRLVGLDEAFVRLPVFHADAIDLELVDPEKTPELLADREIEAEPPDGG